MLFDKIQWANMFLVEHSVPEKCLDHSTCGMQRVVWQMQSTGGFGVFSCWFCHFVSTLMVDLGSTSKAFFKDLQQGCWLMALVTEPVKEALNLVNVSLAV